jgi:DNA polymerase I-like protein with 3'-5' exonuclease and polymerase domains
MDNVELKPLVLNPPLNVTYVNDTQGIDLLLKFLEEQASKSDTATGLDVETDVKKDFYWRRCRTIQFGVLEKQYVVDLLELCDGDSNLLFDCQGEYGKNLYKAPKLQEFIQAITPYVTGKLELVGVNLGFEFSTFYWNFGVQPWNLFDTSVVERCIYAGIHSLKDFAFYGLEEMFGRYFGMQVDKELQTSFTLDQLLSQAQIEYAALDTRLPLAIKKAQELIIKGNTVKSLRAKGQNKAADLLAKLDQQVLGDNLEEICKIENGAINAFISMHIHGERLDVEKWNARVEKNKKELADVVSALDVYFLPLVGSKNEIIKDETILALEDEWKSYNTTRPQELDLKLKLITLRKESRKLAPDSDEASTNRLQQAELEVQMSQWEQQRKLEKEILKTKCSDLKKKRTAINKLAADCEGEALINYSSNAQLIKVLRQMYKQLAKIDSLDDEVLEKYSNLTVMTLIQKYHELSKLVGTYGASWATCWTTHACKEEGWLNPGDQRLHSHFNQQEAETGRSSSSQPNGQNLPQDKEIRSCFIADDGHKLITTDMSGAELRLLAEAANDSIWIDAFNRGEDIHSVCTALLYEEEWAKLALPNCAYYKLKEDGSQQKFKCKCEGHNALRNATKSANFGLCYGIGPRKLSKQIGKTYAETLDLITKHKQLFPNIWTYLGKSGSDAKIFKKAFDVFGRRRLFPEPTWERAKQLLLEDDPDKFLVPSEECLNNLITFETVKGRKPTKDETFSLTHRSPGNDEIAKRFASMHQNIERQGMNHCIQGANASVIKLAMSSLFDSEGKGFLFHILPKYHARLLKMVHDELVVSVPSELAQDVAKELEDAIYRAGAVKVKKLKMLSEYHIEDYWSK